ncbi:MULTISPECIES: nucleotidyltransferase domain-containing protein [unclassified Nostoc]|uniref:nucleotidyltransferase domain-containing protein n=1 Tax=unclassified Nostoc TaxID=2593658 RepID=UPI002AD55243|nr:MULTISPECIES: nucleotidyltransferase domain-containing protein [unclassified Nostoc]MDZ8123616.1 nucleotidyltransferase domain-containing protein [Nostoc sp. CmiVER01]MDZ8227019.1 nucleotidyltransferase domain-containing protein [Nostoc sp. ChiVER01]
MNKESPQFINYIVSNLQSIEGIIAVSLGGSRARGNHTLKSDVDLGIYYNPEKPPDLIALNRLACELDDNHRVNLITAIGEWGKWINGGGWLQVQGVGVDFLYRDLVKVNRVIDDCHAGQITIDYQPGHPHGFVSSIYMGEIAFCHALYDHNGVLEALKLKTKPYPVGLKQATIDTFAWEISFSLLVAKKAIARNDIVYAAGCCFRSVACMNQVLFALNEDYLLNEKGALAIANKFAICPQDYQQRVERAFALLTADAKSITEAIAILEAIEDDLSQWYGNRRLVM